MTQPPQPTGPGEPYEPEPENGPADSETEPAAGEPAPNTDGVGGAADGTEPIAPPPPVPPVVPPRLPHLPVNPSMPDPAAPGPYNAGSYDPSAVPPPSSVPPPPQPPQPQPGFEQPAAEQPQQFPPGSYPPGGAPGMPGGGLPPPGVHPGTHPTGAYYQPGYGVPPLPTKSNRRGWIIGLSIVGAVLLLGCLCCGVFGFVGYRMINDNRHDARAQVKEYYSRLKHHDYNGAYRLLCDSTRADETRQVFTDRQNADPIDDYDVRSVAISGNDVSDFEAKVEEDRHSGASKTVRVDVTREHGDYRICP